MTTITPRKETAYKFVGSGSVWRLCLECGAPITDLEAWEIHDRWHQRTDDAARQRSSREAAA